LDEYEILSDRYDTVVIGAGIGGLTAAAVMARAGVKVLVVEHSHRPGGACSSFRAGDFYFDVGATLVQGFGAFGFNVLRTLFDFLGQQAELIPTDHAYSMLFGGERVDFHLDWHAFTSELAAHFPERAGTLMSFMRDLDRLYNAVLANSGPPRPTSDEPLGQKLLSSVLKPGAARTLSKAMRISAEQLFVKHTDDPDARAFFNADLIFNTGYGIDRLAAPYAALSIMDRLTGGSHYPIGSSQQIPDRLEKSIVLDGGQVAYRTDVTSIDVEEGRASGVRLDDGRRVKCNSVVADVSLATLYGSLIDKSALPQEVVELAQDLVPAGSVVSLFLGVDERAVPKEFNPLTVLVDNPEHGEDFISVSVPSLLDPNLAPEGFHSMIIHAAEPTTGWPIEIAGKGRGEEYEKLKMNAASRVLDRVKDMLPQLEGSAVEIKISSPRTFERWTKRPDGATAGPSMPGSLAPSGLPGAATVVPGVFLTGDSTFYGRGVAQAAASGINCGIAAARYLGLPPIDFEPTTESKVIETVPVRPEVMGEAVVDELSAVLESHRCMRCKESPCMFACPLGIDVPGMMRRVNSAEFAGAAALIHERCELAGCVAALCGKPCEATCTRSETDSSIKISDVETLTCAIAGDEGRARSVRATNGSMVAVIGAGPAGLSCAGMLARLGHKVTLFDSQPEPGGLPAMAMPSFRLSDQSYEREVSHVLELVRVKPRTVFGEDVNFESLAREGYGVVFLATGMQSVRSCTLPGADLPGVIDALSFLTSAKRGVRRELEKNVAVLGDDCTAIDSARLAKSILEDGNVYLVTSLEPDSMRAASESLGAAKAEGVVILTRRKPVALVGEGRVETVRTVPLSGDAEEIPLIAGDDNALKVGTVILAGDRMPDESLTAYLAGQMKLEKDGKVKVNEAFATSRKGVFAGGDAIGTGSFTGACSDGIAAAAEIDEFLGQSPPAPPVPAD